MNPTLQTNSKDTQTPKSKHFHKTININQNNIKKRKTHHKGINLFLNKETQNTISYQSNSKHLPQHITPNKDNKSKQSYFQTCLNFHKDKPANTSKPTSPQNIKTPKNVYSFRLSRNSSFTLNTCVNINGFNNNNLKHNSSLKKFNSNLYYSTYNVNDINLKLLNDNPTTSPSKVQIPSINNNNKTNQTLRRNNSSLVSSQNSQKHYALTTHKRCSLNKNNKMKFKVKQLQIPTLYKKPKNTQINEFNGIVYYEYYNARRLYKKDMFMYLGEKYNWKELMGEYYLKDKKTNMKINNIYINEVLSNEKFPLKNLEILNKAIYSCRNNKES